MIKVCNITKRFNDGSIVAVDDTSFTVTDGIILGLVGDNGAGKSTLLRMLAGVYKPDSGCVLVDEKNVISDYDIRNIIAYVPDSPYFPADATGLSMKKMYKVLRQTFDPNEYDRLIRAFGLNPQAKLSTMSKGQKRQMALILGLSLKPKYLFIDETFDGLDAGKREILKKCIYGNVSDEKMTVVVASHSIRELEDFCDMLAVVRDGKLVYQADMQELVRDVYKIQVALPNGCTQDMFRDVGELLSFTNSGRVATIIVRGDEEKIRAAVDELHPLLVEMLKLNIDEIFSFVGLNGEDGV